MLKTESLVFFLVLVFVSTNDSLAQTKEYVQLLNQFEQWKSIQFKKGIYATEKNCNPDSVTRKNYKGPEIGIPADIAISYTDINNDKKLDALITFNPDQCDGGNAYMNVQTRVLVISNATGYSTDDTFIDKIQERLKKGWIIIESVTGGTFFGTYYEYKDEDGRCCPSVKRPFSIDYSTKKVTFMDTADR